MQRSTALVKGFRQSTPYVNLHRGTTMVIMLPGEAISHSNFSNIISDIALLHSLGVKLVLVHGARPQINQQLANTNCSSRYHKQRRITDHAALTTIMRIAGQLQLAITANLSMSLNNTPMAGTELNVISGNFVIAQPLGIDDGVDYQHSGKIRRIDVAGINRQLDQGTIVLLGPVAGSVTGECFNIPAEEIATAVAIQLNAAKLIGFSSQQGYLDTNGDVIAELFPSQIDDLLHQAEMNSDGSSADNTEGTLRFLHGAVKACLNGVYRSHLVSYQDDGALIQELFSRDGIGTQIVTHSAEQVRIAGISDIGGILDLIQPLEQQGVLVRRSREQLEQEIERFTLIEKDQVVIGCAALYPYPNEKMAEMACVAIHPDYRDGNRGLKLIEHMKQQCLAQGIDQMFVLTTHSLHWFREQGFYESQLESLPVQKQQLYNYHRNSKILVLDII
ncbi:N-acetylglutamate synthase [Vibrio sp. qd031]|uniref:Amino-acid acetyltransferase n=1 Tax=Vibrio ulleungensis TaxID=2807619 RepID=A0ABS2HII3_9VIBR|nr:MULTISPECIES: amino-acid N-acetyltransferase [Vibrio]MBM7036456.1 amino-acid N-acetyltransferase [Vibrio ulleungensis]ORT49239.1 N-acetylglutamate synthase [Vibrio sp. qd031]